MLHKTLFLLYSTSSTLAPCSHSTYLDSLPNFLILVGHMIVVGELSLRSDDATSFATCPPGYTLTRCHCSIPDCDGATLPTNGEENCTVYTFGITVHAIAKCTKFDPKMISTTVTRVPEIDFSEQAIVAYTCPKGDFIVQKILERILLYQKHLQVQC